MPSGLATRARLAALPAIWMMSAPWWHCNLIEPPQASDVGPATQAPPTAPPYRTGDREEKAPREERHPTPKREAQPLLIGEELIVRAIGTYRASFTWCYHRAQRDDPSLGTLKVQLRLYVDPSGVVMDAYSDAEDPKLSTCLVNIARRIQFPAPNEMAMAYIALAW